MRTFKRIFRVLLALAALCGVAAVPVGAADSKYQLTVSKIQRLTPGTAFDPDTAPEVTNVSPGDIFVLTVTFQNNAAAAVDMAGFGVKLLYDASQVKPYTGVEPFDDEPYQVSEEVVERPYNWIAAGNNSKSGFISVSTGGSKTYTVQAGKTFVLARMAFQVNADASGAAAFQFDAKKTTVTDTSRKTLSLAAFQSVRVTLDKAPSYEITAVSADRVTLTNSAPVTLAVSYFDANGQFMSASTQSVPANAGSVPVTFQSAHKVYVMLFDDSFRPLCERCLYVSK